MALENNWYGTSLRIPDKLKEVDILRSDWLLNTLFKSLLLTFCLVRAIIAINRYLLLPGNSATRSFSSNLIKTVEGESTLELL